jgi:hypothetical protein
VQRPALGEVRPLERALVVGDGTGVAQLVDVLSGHADHQVTGPVGVEVARGQGAADVVAGLVGADVVDLEDEGLAAGAR